MTDPHLVVGYDGSEEARAAVIRAAERAGPGGRVTIVHALGPAGALPAIPEDGDRGKAVLDALVLESGNALLDTDFELELADGSPADALVRIARQRDADEIVVGSRGFGRVRAALGSTSHAVLQHADRPVLVVPHHAVNTSG